MLANCLCIFIVWNARMNRLPSSHRQRRGHSPCFARNPFLWVNLFLMGSSRSLLCKAPPQPSHLLSRLCRFSAIHASIARPARWLGKSSGAVTVRCRSRGVTYDGDGSHPEDQRSCEPRNQPGWAGRWERKPVIKAIRDARYWRDAMPDRCNRACTSLASWHRPLMRPPAQETGLPGALRTFLLL